VRKGSHLVTDYCTALSRSVNDDVMVAAVKTRGYQMAGPLTTGRETAKKAK
jgi:hypothetical protein